MKIKIGIILLLSACVLANPTHFTGHFTEKHLGKALGAVKETRALEGVEGRQTWIDPTRAADILGGAMVKGAKDGMYPTYFKYTITIDPAVRIKALETIDGEDVVGKRCTTLEVGACKQTRVGLETTMCLSPAQLEHARAVEGAHEIAHAKWTTAHEQWLAQHPDDWWQLEDPNPEPELVYDLDLGYVQNRWYIGHYYTHNNCEDGLGARKMGVSLRKEKTRDENEQKEQKKDEKESKEQKKDKKEPKEKKK